ncbi:MAG: hypothetical protein HN348_08070 [Proteobacteria bacterium]|nr:hypothetical protein [Pseudomonadota bacterium]
MWFLLFSTFSFASVGSVIDQVDVLVAEIDGRFNDSGFCTSQSESFATELHHAQQLLVQLDYWAQKKEKSTHWMEEIGRAHQSLTSTREEVKQTSNECEDWQGIQDGLAAIDALEDPIAVGEDLLKLLSVETKSKVDPWQFERWGHEIAARCREGLEGYLRSTKEAFHKAPPPNAEAELNTVVGLQQCAGDEELGASRLRMVEADIALVTRNPKTTSELANLLAHTTRQYEDAALAGRQALLNDGLAELGDRVDVMIFPSERNISAGRDLGTAIRSIKAGGAAAVADRLDAILVASKQKLDAKEAAYKALVKEPRFNLGGFPLGQTQEELSPMLTEHFRNVALELALRGAEVTLVGPASPESAVDDGYRLEVTGELLDCGKVAFSSTPSSTGGGVLNLGALQGVFRSLNGFAPLGLPGTSELELRNPSGQRLRLVQERSSRSYGEFTLYLGQTQVNPNGEAQGFIPQEHVDTYQRFFTSLRSCP